MEQYPQKIPHSKSGREALRAKGQFWTPGWITDAMVSYVVDSITDHVFDPAVGAGAFLLAAKRKAQESGRDLQLLGTEIDPDALEQAKANGLSTKDLSNIKTRDFLFHPLQERYKAIVANPPYIRHHRLSKETKNKLKSIATQLIGKALDGRAGYHIYFLLRALELLDADGKLAFIMPADTCEGIFAFTLWKWITCNYRLEAVVAFESNATPFPKLDVNPIIFAIRNSNPNKYFHWALCKKACSEQLREWISSGFNNARYSDLSIKKRLISEGLETGFSRPPFKKKNFRYRLGDFAEVLRGIATGANDFFFLTIKQADDLRIPKEFFKPAIGRTRDVDGDKITNEMFQMLSDNGRPTLLLSIDDRPLEQLPEPVKRYVEEGLRRGVNKKTLISTRNPWYKMETRRIPAFLFAYLGRRNARFIRNIAEVVPLTGFLCVYPYENGPQYIDKLWRVLGHPKTISNLRFVGKSYGKGAIKVEPRGLERLPLPDEVLQTLNLCPPKKTTRELPF